jgi:hypothetical protein
LLQRIFLIFSLTSLHLKQWGQLFCLQLPCKPTGFFNTLVVRTTWELGSWSRWVCFSKGHTCNLLFSVRHTIVVVPPIFQVVSWFTNMPEA